MALELRLATPEQIGAGYWDRCPYCEGRIFLPVAGSKESKVPVRCPSCIAVIQPDC